MAQCVGIRVVSFNVGIPQSMLESTRKWNRQHVFRFRDVLTSLGAAAGNDFVLCSEVGDSRQGLGATSVDFQHLVQEALVGAASSTSGAYLNVWNVCQRAAAVVQSGTWTATSGHSTDMYWQAFDLTYRDASQLAAPKVGLLVGNMHIPVGRSSAPTHNTRRRIVEQALQHLAHLEVDAWRARADFPVMRLLVGDCNLPKEAAEAATPLVRPPPLTALQRDFNLRRWQVLSTDAQLSGDVMFVLGGFGEERTVPIGASFEDRGMRNDVHDAVGAQLMIPIGRIRSGGARPATDGASQPAVAAGDARPAAGGASQSADAASAAEQVPASGAPQAATAAAERALESEHPAGADRPAAGGAPQPAEAASAAEQAPASGAPQAATAAADEAESNATAPNWSMDTSLNEAVSELHDKLREVEESDDISPEVQKEVGKILFKKKR